MDAVTLLSEAHCAGVKIEIVSGILQVEAKESQKHWLKKLEPHKAEIMALVAASDQQQEPAEADLWPEPQPLPDLLPKVAPFDTTMLPEAVRPFVEDVAERMQCPRDFPAVAMMIVLAGVVGRKIAIRPKCQDDWTVIPNLWGLIVGRPGLMKTPAITEPTKFLKRLEIESKTSHEAAKNEYQVAEIIAKAARQNAEQAVKKSLRDGKDATEIARQAITQEHEPPIRRRYLVNDPSVEKLGEILSQNPNGVTLIRDEIYSFLRSLDKDGHEHARGFYLEAWNGNGRYSYDRIGRGTIDIDAAVLSMIGTIQPSRLAEYVRQAVRGGSGDDGLIQRFQLAVWPDCPSEWRNVDRWPDARAKNQVFDLVCGLDEMAVADVGAVQLDDEDFPYLRFCPNAQELFYDWHLRLETRLRANVLAPAMESHLAKYRSLIPSLALLIHLADGGVEQIPVLALEKAIQWGEYLESHAGRVYASAVHSDVAAAQCLAKRIAEGVLDDRFTLKDVYRPGWTGLSTREDAQAAIEMLCDLHWLEAFEISTAGRKRTEHRINPKIQQTALRIVLPELPKAPFGSFGSSHEEASVDVDTDRPQITTAGTTPNR